MEYLVAIVSPVFEFIINNSLLKSVTANQSLLSIKVKVSISEEQETLNLTLLLLNTIKKY